jgi:hypothetical protein
MSLERDDIKIEVLRLNNEGLSLRKISDIVGVNRTSLSKFLRKESHKEWWNNHKKPLANGTLHDHYNDIKKLDGKCFIITSAQNNTYVHSRTLMALEQIAKHRNAQILVGTFSYNLSGFQNLQKSEGEWFDPKLKDYIVDEPVLLADSLVYCGELNILPTATNPLSGFQSYTKNKSGIIPHVKMQLESLPGANGDSARFLYTTGTVTKRNYVQKKAGQKASFHHIFGALIVEIDDTGDWFVRQLIADTHTGEIQDLNVHYTPYGWTENVSVEAINWGDIHAEQLDEVVAYTCFGKNGMLDTLKPKYQFGNDIMDFSARNHHNINDPYFRFKSYIRKQDTVKGDIQKVATVMKMMERPYCQTVIVESNHDLALQKWLRTADYKTDPANAIFFLELQLAQYKAIEAGFSNFSIFEFALKTVEPSLMKVKFLKTDESFMVCGDDGVECGSHGHLGNNGAKGSIKAYTYLGKRYNIGHSHSCAIYDGVYQAGTCSKLDLGYNKGGSSWSHSQIVTYPNGKRAIVTIKNGKWRA